MHQTIEIFVFPIAILSAYTCLFQKLLFYSEIPNTSKLRKKEFSLCVIMKRVSQNKTKITVPNFCINSKFWKCKVMKKIG